MLGSVCSRVNHNHAGGLNSELPLYSVNDKILLLSVCQLNIKCSLIAIALQVLPLKLTTVKCKENLHASSTND